MNLPNYFLADLPREATLSASLVTEACRALKRNREHYLQNRSIHHLICVLSEVAQNWLQPDYPLRKSLLQLAPASTGFQAATLAAGLDAFFARFTVENLQALILQELGHLRRLEELTATEAELKAGRASFVRGPELFVHIASGTLPNPTLMSIVLGLLTRSAQFVKCATGGALIPRLFAHSLYEAEPKLGACLEIAEWKGGLQSVESALFAEADCVTATGTNETLAAIRQQLPAQVRFIGYGHRVSFGYVASEVLAGFQARKIINRAAGDVVAWNQMGCLSPHVIYVENNGEMAPEQFAEMLAAELEATEQTLPRGPVTVEEAAGIALRRSFYEIRAAHSSETRLWSSAGSTAWTVVYENDPLFQMSCLNRFIYVKSISGLEQVLRSADAVRGQVSTVGLAASEDRAQNLANQLARWGVTRVCPLGQMQNPPLTWRHDGRPSLGDLVTWTDWEL
ncbi:MAG: acyl-CoA reductase [Verrucomicrobiota bacterium]